ncbi:MAG: hypothetical protein PQJ47_12330 [Sphaerochaetaceae bacterium]|nr:hypothetical protein [Sphaerochaetaceae bacterium]
MEENMTYTIVKFVEDRVVTRCSDGREVEILFEMSPSDSKIGDILVYQEGLYIKK